MFNILSLDEVSAKLQLDAQEVKNLFSRGVISGKKVGHNWVTTTKEIDNYIRIKKAQKDQSFKDSLLGKLEGIVENTTPKNNKKKCTSGCKGYISMEDAATENGISVSVLKKIVKIKWVKKKLDNNKEPLLHKRALKEALESIDLDTILIAEMLEMQTEELKDSSNSSRVGRLGYHMQRALEILRTQALKNGVPRGTLVSQAIDWYKSEYRLNFKDLTGEIKEELKFIDKTDEIKTVLEFIDQTDPAGFLAVVKARMAYI